VHRIGRTGRAGRSGEAILFVAPRERNMLRIIERVTKQRLEPMTLPSVADVNEQRVLKFKERVAAAVQSGQGAVFEELLRQMESEQNIPAIELAAALAGLLQGPTPFLLPQKKPEEEAGRATGAWAHDASTELPHGAGSTSSRASAHAPESDARSEADRKPAHEPRTRRSRENGPPMESFRIEVGHVHGVQPGNIVGAIANEAGLDGRHIGHIDIREDHSFVDLPEGMPKEIFRSLKKVRVRGTELRISRVESKPPRPEGAPRGARPSERAHPRKKGTGFSRKAGKPHRARKER
jgi:ATP-dependent RNA helicase DeaD